MNIKLDKHKSLVQDLNVDISNTSEESNGENNNMSPDHEKKSKGMCDNIVVNSNLDQGEVYNIM
jgi:hypothetical protein